MSDARNERVLSDITRQVHSEQKIIPFQIMPYLDPAQFSDIVTKVGFAKLEARNQFFKTIRFMRKLAQKTLSSTKSLPTMNPRFDCMLTRLAVVQYGVGTLW